ncbi:hypothetical protein ZOSMA_82G00740 [Zostera marina]|uniref:BRI1 kinase inhibitor 1 n=1 Tax=Zostera marina TaxID=29655 RepID=A0A0K9NMC6_ZOSMR|nr:hypothetical protein ZOSMA_82G00740 [Zostera marina]
MSKEIGMAKTSSTSTSSPPSSITSPSHEFSFTITFHPSPLQTTPKSLTSSIPSPTIDLSPADDIFFHGHLLPLHLLSRPPPPSFPPLPALNTTTDYSQPPIISAPPTECNYNTTDDAVGAGKTRTTTDVPAPATAPKSSSKTFYSLFSGRGKVRKLEEDEKKKKRSFDVGRMLRKYAVVLETLLFSRGGGGNKEKREVRKRPYTFSTSSNWKGREEWFERGRKKWGNISAPASMRTSPTNSGLIIATGCENFGSSDESTMEELQSAIQAAIAHCKNSTAANKEEDQCSSKQL